MQYLNLFLSCFFYVHLCSDRCKVPKDAPHAVLQSPHPYNNTKVKSDSKLNRSTGDENQPVTKGAVITPHPTSPKHERACTSKDPPTGGSSSHESSSSGCEIPRNVSVVTPTEIPPLSESHNATPSLPHTSKSRSNEDRKERKEDTGKHPSPDQRIHIPPQATTGHYSQTSATQTPAPDQSSTRATTVDTKSHETVTAHSHGGGVSTTSQSDAFQSNCTSCLNENVTKRVTTAKPSSTALQILSRATVTSQKHTTDSVTAGTPALMQRTTVPSINKIDSWLPWMDTSVPPTTKASSRLTWRGLRRHIALRNLTGECKQLLILSLLECQLPTR